MRLGSIHEHLLHHEDAPTAAVHQILSDAPFAQLLRVGGLGRTGLLVQELIARKANDNQVSVFVEKISELFVIGLSCTSAAGHVHDKNRLVLESVEREC